VRFFNGEALDGKAIRDPAAKAKRRDMCASTISVITKPMEWADDVIILDPAGTQGRAQVRATVQTRVWDAINTAPEHELPDQTFKTDRLAAQLATLEKRIPVIVQNTHEQV
jgi:hypothetical protein